MNYGFHDSDKLFILNSILELFGVPGGYNVSNDFLHSLTQKELIDMINTKTTRLDYILT